MTRAATRVRYNGREAPPEPPKTNRKRRALIGNDMHSPASASPLRTGTSIFLIGNEFHLWRASQKNPHAHKTSMGHPPMHRYFTPGDAFEELGLSLRREWPPQETMPRRPGPPKHCIQIGQLRAKPVTSKGNTQKRGARPRPKATVKPQGARDRVTKQRPPKEALSELLQRQETMTRQSSSFVTPLYYKFHTDPSRRHLQIQERALFQVGGQGVAPDVVGEPVPVFLGYGELLFGLGDGMAEAFVENEFHGDATVLESAIELERIGDGNARVFAALLNQRGRVRVVDVSDGRGLAVDFRVAPRSGVQILARERSDVRVDVVSHPVGNSGAHRDSAEAVAERGDERGDVAALAPTHGADALWVNEALRDEVIDAGNHVSVIAHAEIADVERPEFRAVARRAAIVRFENHGAARGEKFDGIVTVRRTRRATGARGASVNFDEQRIFLRRIEIRGLHQDSFDGCAVAGFPFDHFASAKLEIRVLRGD